MIGDSDEIRKIRHMIGVINITPDNPFAYCLTAIGFLNFNYAQIAK